MNQATDVTVQKTITEIINTASVAVASASTPEEAYKKFMAAAGKGMMQVMADALAAAVSMAATETATNPDIAGWERFVKGCTVSLDFGAPLDFDDSAALAAVTDFKELLTNKLTTAAQPKNSPSLLGGSITVGGSWSF